MNGEEKQKRLDPTRLNYDEEKESMEKRPVSKEYDTNMMLEMMGRSMFGLNPLMERKTKPTAEDWVESHSFYLK